jgi:uncharacterized protein (DUF4415 family)
MSGKKRATRKDWSEFDRHVVGKKEYADIPELTDAWFDKADMNVRGKPVRRGRPLAASPKQAVSIRLSPEVIRHFRAGGRGWQTRIDEALRDWIKRVA